VGLPVVKHLVEQSGGTLAVGSGEGMGSCFVVSLPMFDEGDYLE
jgi:signal transduction histidine kinase